MDVPRTIPKGSSYKLLQNENIKKLLFRVLYIWSKEHPVIAYFQGLGDLVAVFISTFASEYTNSNHEISDELCLLNIEADVYYCITAMLEEFLENSPLFDKMFSLLNKMQYLIQLADCTKIIFFFFFFFF